MRDGIAKIGGAEYSPLASSTIQTRSSCTRHCKIVLSFEISVERSLTEKLDHAYGVHTAFAKSAGASAAFRPASDSVSAASGFSFGKTYTVNPVLTFRTMMAASNSF